MAEKRLYNIIVQRELVKVSREVYYAYHKAREAERYQIQFIGTVNLSDSLRIPSIFIGYGDSCFRIIQICCGIERINRFLTTFVLKVLLLALILSAIYFLV